MQIGMGLTSINENDIINKNIDFFNKNCQIYKDASTNGGALYPFYRKYLRNLKIKILDVGGGDGSFCILLKKNFPEAEVTLLEPSENLISQCEDPCISKRQGSLPDKLNLVDSEEFDFIFMRFVLHHLAARTIASSRSLAKASLLELKKHLNHNGYLIISETFYESYFITTFVRNVLFHLLDVQNYLGLRIPLPDFQLGLRVCFYTRSELKQLFSECGFVIIELKDNYVQGNIIQKTTLKAWGFTDFILKINTRD